MSIIYLFLYKATVYVPDKPTKPGIIFVDKSIAYQSNACFMCSSQSYDPGWAKNIRLGLKGLPGTKLALKNIRLEGKSIYHWALVD